MGSPAPAVCFIMSRLGKMKEKKKERKRKDETYVDLILMTMMEYMYK